MPLSENEKRRFDEIERALFDDDPVFSTTVTMTRLRRRRIQASIAYFSVAMVLLVVGPVLTQGSVALGTLVSITGFMIMVWAVALFLRYRRSR